MTDVPSSTSTESVRESVMQMASRHAENWNCHDHAAPSMLCDFAMTVLRMPGIAQTSGGSEAADGAIGSPSLTGAPLKCQPSRLEGETTRPAGIASSPSETKTVYVKRWRTLVNLPAKYADEIVDALRGVAQAGQHSSDCAVHNAPALPIGPCNCGAELAASRKSPRGVAAVRLVSEQETPSIPAQPLPAAQAAPDRDAIARIIEPDAMLNYEADFGKGKSPTWDQITSYPRVKSARWKADAILALFAAPQPASNAGGETWEPVDFWKFVSGLAGEHEADQMRDMLAQRGLQIAGIGDPASKASETVKVTELSRAILDIANERFRQVEDEGWTADHDNAHPAGMLAIAGAAYARSAHNHLSGLKISTHDIRHWWPWDAKWWKPTGFRSDLIKAAALIVAEIERLDRASTVLSTDREAGK